MTREQWRPLRGLPLQVVRAPPIGDIPVPSIVHLRSQHFAAIVAMKGGKYVLRDPGSWGARSD